MQAVRLKKPGVVLEEIPVPEISAGEALVKVKYAGICGTDAHSIEGPGFYEDGTYLGHEYSGVIIKIGNKVKGLKPGDRVTAMSCCACGECYACERGLLSCCPRFLEDTPGSSTDERLPGAFAEFIRVPKAQKRLFLIPDGVSFEEGALVEPLACSLHAIRISAFKPGDDTIVMGAGPLGLGAIAFLKHGGAGLVIATEVNKKEQK